MKLNRSISAKLNKSTKRLRLILGDQLNASHSWFKQNGRMNRVYRRWQIMDQGKQNALIEKAETLLANLESL